MGTTELPTFCTCTMARNKKASDVDSSENRSKKLRLWTDEAMLGAMKAVATGTMGVNRTALEYGVPRTTLKDRISGRVVHGTNMGTKPYLSKEEETELVDFLITCCNAGYGKTRKDVLAIVGTIVQKRRV